MSRTSQRIVARATLMPTCLALSSLLLLLLLVSLPSCLALRLLPDMEEACSQPLGLQDGSIRYPLYTHYLGTCIVDVFIFLILIHTILNRVSQFSFKNDSNILVLYSFGKCLILLVFLFWSKRWPQQFQNPLLHPLSAFYLLPLLHFYFLPLLNSYLHPHEAGQSSTLYFPLHFAPHFVLHFAPPHIALHIALRIALHFA